MNLKLKTQLISVILLLAHFSFTNCQVENIEDSYAFKHGNTTNSSSSEKSLSISNNTSQSVIQNKTVEYNISNETVLVSTEKSTVVISSTDKPKVEKPGKINSALEPVNSGEHELNNDQKVIKKQLKDDNKNNTNEPKVTEKPINTFLSVTTESPVQIDLNLNATTTDDKSILKPGAKKRAFIVFGSLAVIVAGYIAYKRYRRGKNYHHNDLSFEVNDSHFKYDALISSEMGDNLEMANIPLTADSDDDEELEIFDLEGNKNFSKGNDVNGHLLAKDDVEIIDLDIPGYSRSAATRESSQDDDLLNLDEEIDNVLKSSSIRNNGNNNPKTDTSDNLFNIL